jgi:hypothetical protein
LTLRSLVARKHWGIENQLHWRLDVIFNEDKACVRNDNAAENMNILRKWSMSMLVKAKKAVSVSKISHAQKFYVPFTLVRCFQENSSCLGPAKGTIPYSGGVNNLLSLEEKLVSGMLQKLSIAPKLGATAQKTLWDIGLSVISSTKNDRSRSAKSSR